MSRHALPRQSHSHFWEIYKRCSSWGPDYWEIWSTKRYETKALAFTQVWELRQNPDAWTYKVVHVSKTVTRRKRAA